jgi:type IV pilus assembly protein PilN
MRLDINLASQPYEDARQFWLRWGGALAAVALFTLVLLMATTTGWFNARRDRSKIADLRHQIELRDQTRRGAEEILNRPENRSTRDESRFLNQLIERKSFSWTRVLEDMEKVMPARVHLVSIHPELDDENQLALKMVVAGQSRDRGIELAQRMEDSRRFTQTHVTEERYTPSTTGDSLQLNIDAIYVPETIPAPASTVAPAAALPKPKTSSKGSKP